MRGRVPNIRRFRINSSMSASSAAAPSTSAVLLPQQQRAYPAVQHQPRHARIIVPGSGSEVTCSIMPSGGRLVAAGDDGLAHARARQLRHAGRATGRLRSARAGRSLVQRGQIARQAGELGLVQVARQPDQRGPLQLEQGLARGRARSAASRVMASRSCRAEQALQPGLGEGRRARSGDASRSRRPWGRLSPAMADHLSAISSERVSRAMSSAAGGSAGDRRG